MAQSWCATAKGFAPKKMPPPPAQLWHDAQSTQAWLAAARKHMRLHTLPATPWSCIAQGPSTFRSQGAKYSGSPTMPAGPSQRRSKVKCAAPRGGWR